LITTHDLCAWTEVRARSASARESTFPTIDSRAERFAFDYRDEAGTRSRAARRWR
jgi:hypothetical protein